VADAGIARFARAIAVASAAISISVLALTGSPAESLFDESVRAEMLRHRDGPIAHIETEYNDQGL
jgi:hypothetical protein